jgi:HEPN domain-containing protein
VLYEDLCFNAQQAVEKAIKAFLIFYDVEPEKTHNLVTLINKLKQYVKFPEKLDEAAELNHYAVQTRYPGDYTPIEEDEYRRAIEIADYCVKWIDQAIKKTIKQLEDEKQTPFLDNIN